MKNLLRYKWYVVGLLLVFGMVLVYTGMAGRILQRVHITLLKAGLIEPQEVVTAEFEPRELPDETATNFVLTDEKGQSIPLADFRGKPVFLNQWATWCAPCIAEMPGIQELYGRTGKEVHFLMVSRDRDFQKALDFKAEKGYEFPVYRVEGSMPGIFRSRTIPVTYLITSKGNQMYRYEGMREYNTEAFQDFLLGLGQ